jgi:hypothetical protein
MFGVGNFGISPIMFRLFLAGVLICSLGASVLTSNISPPTATEGTVSPAVHANNECHSDQDGAGPRYYYIAIQNNRPEEAQ